MTTTRHVLAARLTGPFPLDIATLPYRMTGPQARKAREKLGLSRQHYAEIMGMTVEGLRRREHRRDVPGEVAVLLSLLSLTNATIDLTLAPDAPKPALRRRAPSSTHCRNGHVRDLLNTRATDKGTQVCRACHRDRCRESRARNQASSTPTSETP